MDLKANKEMFEKRYQEYRWEIIGQLFWYR